MFVRPRPWSIVVFAALLAAAAGLWIRGDRLATATAVVSALTWLDLKKVELDQPTVEARRSKQ
jgi:hypothetical protein